MSVSSTKLKIWAGLKRPVTDLSTIRLEISLIEENIGDFQQYQNDISGFTSHSEHETYLENNGFTADEADAFTAKIQANFTDEDSSGTEWDEYNAFVQSVSSFEELKNGFSSESQLASDSETAEGESVAGIRTFDSAGVTKDGISVPAGATEVYGAEIHFSQTGHDHFETSPETYSNLTVSDQAPEVGATITVSVDVTNPNSFGIKAVATLTEDGSAIQTETVVLGGNSTKTVSFSVSKDQYVCHDYTVSDLSAITVCWAPGGL